MKDPTAKQPEVVGHTTALSPAVLPDGSGLAEIDHAAPFHRSISGAVLEPFVY